MPSDSQLQLDNDTYRALGRFVVAFSRLLYSLETSTIHLFGLGPDGERITLIEAALAGRTASPIVSAFFSVFFKRWESHLPEEDMQVLKSLRKELDAIVQERNRIMHDAWMSTTVGGDPGPHPLTRIRTRTHGRGIEFESVSYDPGTLDDLAEDADRLSRIVNASVWYRRPRQVGPELHPRLQIINGKVTVAQEASE